MTHWVVGRELSLDIKTMEERRTRLLSHGRFHANFGLFQVGRGRNIDGMGSTWRERGWVELSIFWGEKYTRFGNAYIVWDCRGRDMQGRRWARAVREGELHDHSAAQDRLYRLE